jgi:hypothetical protein
MLRLVPLITLIVSRDITTDAPYVIGRLPARHTKAFHKLIGHPRSELVAECRSAIYLGIEYPVDLCAGESFLDEPVNQIGPSETSGIIVENRDDTRADVTDSAPDPCLSLAINTSHLKNSAGEKPARHWGVGDAPPNRNVTPPVGGQQP